MKEEEIYRKMQEENIPYWMVVLEEIARKRENKVKEINLKGGNKNV
jgi:hypothetical protein